MPRYGDLHTDKTAAETMRDIEDAFRKWGVTRWDAPHPAKIGGAEAVLRFEINGEPKVLRCGQFHNYATNLRALYRTVDDLRIASQRGILEQYRQYFAELPPPSGEPAFADEESPWDVLQIREGAPLAIAESAYRTLSKESHPDAGGHDRAQARLNRAIQRIRSRGE